MTAEVWNAPLIFNIFKLVGNDALQNVTVENLCNVSKTAKSTYLTPGKCTEIANMQLQITISADSLLELNPTINHGYVIEIQWR